MKTTVAILAAALPFAASAEKVYVEFDGIVVPSNSPLRAGYNIGDSVSGTLLIDTLLAPTPRADLLDPHPEHRFAWYGWPRPPERSFISGFAGDKEPLDFVLLEAGRGAFLGTTAIGIQDSNPSRTLFVRGRSDLLSLDLVQTVDIQPEEDSGEFFGWFEWGKKLIERVHFRMTRFSITPGSCRP